MQKYIFLDLDDTLFQTLRKCPLPKNDPRLEVRAFLPDGTPNSFATHKQQWLWDWLAKDFKIVPVTARDIHAFERVTLEFQEEVVLNHGAVILTKQRKVDDLWMASMLANLPRYHLQLMEIWADVTAFAEQSEGYKLRLVNDFEVTWYGVVKHAEGTETILQTLVDAVLKTHPHILSGALYWHLNSNNLAILPKIINKESAVAYLINQYQQHDPDLLTLGAGDSKTDAAFMALCDYAMIPSRTQLFNTLAQIP
jgi:hydroxymethylpyrimidine pyrophosphatase-like HAD family hydrolase